MIDTAQSIVSLLFTQLRSVDSRHPAFAVPLCANGTATANCSGPIVAAALSSSVLALMTATNVQLWDVREANYQWVQDSLACSHCASLVCDSSAAVCYDPFRPLVRLLPPVNYSRACSSQSLSAVALSASLLAVVCTQRNGTSPYLSLYGISTAIQNQTANGTVSAYATGAEPSLQLTSLLNTTGLSLASFLPGSPSASLAHLSVSVTARLLLVSMTAVGGVGSVFLSVVDSVLGLNVYQPATAAPGGDVVLLTSPAGVGAADQFGWSAALAGTFLLVGAPSGLSNAGVLYAFILPNQYNSTAWSAYRLQVTASASSSLFCQLAGVGNTVTADVSPDASHVLGGVAVSGASSTVRMFVVNASLANQSLVSGTRDPLALPGLLAPPVSASVGRCNWLDSIGSQGAPRQLTFTNEMVAWLGNDGSLHSSAYCFYGSRRVQAGGQSILPTVCAVCPSANSAAAGGMSHLLRHVC